MVSINDVRKAARLSRIKLDSSKESILAEELSEIITMIDSLNELDTGSVEPLLSVVGHDLPMREDVASTEDLREEIFSNAPGEKAEFAKEIKYFIVPTVIE